MRTSDEGERIVRLTFALILFVGVFVRTVAIGREALWGDEALTVLITRLPTFDLFFRPVDPTPGLYYALHKWFVPAGSGAAATRLVALFFGVLTIPAGYWLGRAALDRRAGLALAALIAVSPWLIDYSQEARAYSLLVFLVTCSAAALIDAFPSDESVPVRWRMLGAFAILGIAAIYTHFIGWLWTGPALLAAAIEIDRRKTPRRGVILGSFILFFLLAVAPEFFRLTAYALSPRNAYNWLEQPDAANAVKIVWNVLLPVPTLSGWLKAPLGWERVLNAVIPLLFALWMAAAAVKLRKRECGWTSKQRMTLAAILISLSLPVQTMVIGALTSPILLERSLLPMVPGFLLLLILAAKLKGGRVAIMLIAASYLAASLSIGFVRQKKTMRISVATVERAGLENKAIVVCPSWEVPALILALREAGNNASVIAATPYGHALIVKRGESDALWQDRYTTLLMGSNLPAYATRPRPRLVKGLIEAPEFVRIWGDCSPPELQALARWLGKGKVETIATRRKHWAPEISKVTPESKSGRVLIVDARN